MIKLIALDVDGTVLRSDQTFSNATCEALRACEKKGVEWMLVTGRNYDIVKPILDEYGLQCDLILNSGHEYRDKHGVQKKCVWMEEEKIRIILDVLLRFDYHMSVHTDKGKYIFMDKEAYFRDHIEMARRKWKSGLDGLRNCALYDKEKFLYNCHEVRTIEELFAAGVRVLKIDARNFAVDKVRESIGMVKKLEGIVIHSSYESFIEISDKSSNKAKMLKEVLSEKGILEEEVAVFGDSGNDLELFEEFEHSFAMANASDEIKQIAKYHTDTNDQDGVAKGIHKILNNIL